MRKLNNKKIRWIIREIEKGSSMSWIAQVQDVTRVRIWQLYNQYLSTGEIPKLMKPGKKPESISEDDRALVNEMYEKHRVGPLALEVNIKRETGKHIPHNRIYKIMLAGGKIVENPRKKKQRKYVRYERTHSMSLWQGDWKLLSHTEDGDKWLIAFLDDASRRIMCYGIYDNANTENVIRTLESGFEEFGCPREILTDHGCQFTANKKDKKGNAKHRFPEFLEIHGIKHILARVHHPQTNGKIERFFGTLEQKRKLFDDDIDQLMNWYNTDKTHMSLDFANAETPAEAFWRKLPEERIMGYGGWMFEV